MKIFYDALNLTSLIAGILGVLMIITLGLLRPNLLKRVSLQLQIGIALLDITRHLQLHVLSTPENSILCALVAFYGYFSDHLYIYLNVAIALNLQLLLIHQIKPKSFLKWTYWVASVGISSSINLVPLSLNYFGKRNSGNCLLLKKIPSRFLLKFFLVHVVAWPGVIYCLSISTIIIYRCYFKKPLASDTTIYSQFKVRRLSWTIALYPMTCFFTMIGYLSNNLILDLFGRSRVEIFYIFSKIGLCSTGALNLLCLIMDDQVWSTIKSFCRCSQERHLNIELGLKPSSKVNGSAGKKIKNFSLDPPASFDSYSEQREELIRFL